MIRLAIALAAAALLAAACSDGTNETAAAKPIAAILASDIDIAVDPEVLHHCPRTRHRQT